MILQADARHIPLADETVQCVVTSPPFWGLRDYGLGKDQLGLEPTPELFVTHLVEIFREVRRVMRPDATCWVNLGDSYFGSWQNYGGGNRGAGKQRPIVKGSQAQNPVWEGLEGYRSAATFNHPTLKPKDLCGIPWRVAFALQADGWWLRSDIIWAKPNPMPESVTSRPTKSHEYIFLLTKSEKYFYDQEAVREPKTGNEHARGPNGNARVNPKAAAWPAGWDSSTGEGGHGRFHRLGREGVNSRMHIDRDPQHSQGRKTRPKQNESFAAAMAKLPEDSGRNLRSVWTMATQPFKGAHFATFPEELAARCIKAGTSAKGRCRECGKAWGRIVESTREHGLAQSGFPKSDGTEATARLHRRLKAARDAGEPHDNALGGNKTLGWQPVCSCNAGDPVSCVVLDPFSGAGTTALVADKLGRIGIGIELKAEYAVMARERIIADAPLLAQREGA